VLVPKDADLVPPPIDEYEANSEIACNYNTLKGLVALVQSIYAISTLYDTRGDQIARYGYAAFGLTVSPYVVMSLINLIGGMMTPQYPCLYMVGSSIMDEAQSRPGFYFQGTVGRLAEVESERSQHLESEEGHFQILNRPISFEQVDGTPLRARVYVSTNDGQDSLQSGQPDLSQDHTTDIEMSLVEHQEESVILQIEYEHQRAAALPQDDHGNEEVADDAARATLVPQPPQNHADQSETLLFVPDSSRTRLRFDGIGHRSPRISNTVSRQTQFDENKTAALFELGQANHLQFTYICAILLGCFPLAIIGVLSKFRNGESTRAQRGWAMSWWVFGIVTGSTPAFYSYFIMNYKNKLVLLIHATPAIGGFVVVGQMLASYGTCVSIS